MLFTDDDLLTNSCAGRISVDYNLWLKQKNELAGLRLINQALGVQIVILAVALGWVVYLGH